MQIYRQGVKINPIVGLKIQVGDYIRTSKNGYVGITLKDDTIISASKSSVLIVQDFKFNTTTYEGNVFIDFIKGTFNVISGLIRKTDPSEVKYRSGEDVILSIRGTEMIIEAAGKDVYND